MAHFPIIHQAILKNFEPKNLEITFFEIFGCRSFYMAGVYGPPP